VRATVQVLLDRLEPAPALVVNRLTDVLAWTSGYDRLARPLGILDADPPNLVRFTLLDERSRAVFPDWDVVATEQVASLQGVPTDGLRTFVEELRAAVGEEFDARWRQHPVGIRTGTGLTRLVHPEAGLLRLAVETMQLPDADDQRLIVHLPADEATAAALDRITGRPLHVVRPAAGA
jgi:hypothetical protein